MTSGASQNAIWECIAQNTRWTMVNEEPGDGDNNGDNTGEHKSEEPGALHASLHGREAAIATAHASAQRLGMRRVFVATDANGICEALRGMNTSALSCVDIPPVHSAKPHTYGEHRGRLAAISAASALAPGDEPPMVLEPGHTAIIDWYLVSRSRWMGQILRSGGKCQSNPALANRSFFSWALALSGLALASEVPAMTGGRGRGERAEAVVAPCTCELSIHDVYVWNPAC